MNFLLRTNLSRDNPASAKLFEHTANLSALVKVCTVVDTKIER
ncbi:MAG: hypothetical protein CLLPBCKN_007851 [Chroococcidiopsis cubana SAG 39.79]|jgi:hypothetical protein|nr:hypothetical protein [Chroococcidiopsis cubana SAG 39.79]